MKCSGLSLWRKHDKCYVRIVGFHANRIDGKPIHLHLLYAPVTTEFVELAKPHHERNVVMRLTV